MFKYENLKNEFILDGKIQRDIKLFDSLANFNISATTGQTITLENRKKNRYTFIRVIYTGKISDGLKRILCENSFIRIYGKLDSEQYIDRNGKTVYNKILHATKICKLVSDQEGNITEIEVD